MGTQKTIIFRPKYLNKNNSKSVRWDFDINKSKFIEKDPSKKKGCYSKKKVLSPQDTPEVKKRTYGKYSFYVSLRTIQKKNQVFTF